MDLLRTLLGEGMLPRGLLHEGVPSCAITTVHNLDVIEVASGLTSLATFRGVPRS